MIDIQKTKSNKYRRFYLSLFIVCFMISFSAIVVNAESNNLLENEGFEDDNLKGWEEVQWNTDSETTYIIYDYSDFNSGTASIKLSNIEENDYRLRQSVNVDDQQIYRFSAFVKTENIKVGTYGGAISIWETFAGTGSIITNGEWQYHEFYGVTNKGQK